MYRSPEGTSVDSSCLCFGNPFRVHSNPTCPLRLFHMDHLANPTVPQFNIAELDEIWEVFKTSKPGTAERKALRSAILSKVNSLAASMLGENNA